MFINCNAWPVANQVLIRLCPCGTTFQISSYDDPNQKCAQCTEYESQKFYNLRQLKLLRSCPSCSRFLRPPTTWVNLDSTEFMDICLAELQIPAGFILENAQFLVNNMQDLLTIQSFMLEIILLKNVQQGHYGTLNFHICYFIARDKQCQDCSKPKVPNNVRKKWEAKLEVHCHRNHKKTLYYLEQLLVTIDAAEKISLVKSVPYGLDMFFKNANYAIYFCNFISRKILCDCRQKDIGDKRSLDFSLLYVVKLVPFSKGNIICLDPILAKDLQIRQLCIIQKIDHVINIIDPTTAQVAYVDRKMYRTYPPICITSTQSMLAEYLVLHIDHGAHSRTNSIHQLDSNIVNKSKLDVAEVWVQRVSKFGVGDVIFSRTHLGSSLKKGDIVLGCELKSIYADNHELSSRVKLKDVPELIIVKKVNRKDDQTSFKLKAMTNLHPIMRGQDSQYLEFFDELKEDQSMAAELLLFSKNGDLKSYDELKIANACEADDFQNTLELGITQNMDQAELLWPSAEKEVDWSFTPNNI